MNNLADQGDAGAGPLAPLGRKPWATPRVIVSVDAADAGKNTTPQAELIPAYSASATPS